METFADRVEFVLLDLDDASQDGIRRRLGITAQAQYLFVNSAGEVIGRWFGRIDEAQVTADMEALLLS